MSARNNALRETCQVGRASKTPRGFPGKTHAFSGVVGSSLTDDLRATRVSANPSNQVKKPKRCRPSTQKKHQLQQRPAESSPLVGARQRQRCAGLGMTPAVPTWVGHDWRYKQQPPLLSFVRRFVQQARQTNQDSIAEAVLGKQTTGGNQGGARCERLPRKIQGYYPTGASPTSVSARPRPAHHAGPPRLRPSWTKLLKFVLSSKDQPSVARLLVSNATSARRLRGWVCHRTKIAFRHRGAIRGEQQPPT